MFFYAFYRETNAADTRSFIHVFTISSTSSTVSRILLYCDKKARRYENA